MTASCLAGELTAASGLLATKATPWLALLSVPLAVATFGGVMVALPDRINSVVAVAGNAMAQALGDIVGKL